MYGPAGQMEAAQRAWLPIGEGAIAGIGSRFLALVVDHLIQAVLMLAVLVAATGTVFRDISVYLPSRAREMRLTLWVCAALVVVTFLMLWGYLVFCEMMWNGQTPGKRLFRVRAVRPGGYPVDFLASAARNLVR